MDLSALGALKSLRAIWGSGPNDVYAVGGGAVLLHWNGSAWGRIDVGGLVNNIPQPAPSFSPNAG